MLTLPNLGILLKCVSGTVENNFPFFDLCFLLYYSLTVVLQHNLSRPSSKIRLRMNPSRPQACNLPTRIFWGNPCVHCFLFNLRSSRLTAWCTRTQLEETQYTRTTACSVCPLACHPFGSDCIWLALSTSSWWINQTRGRPGVDSNHQGRHQEKQNKFFLHFHGQAVYSSV